MQQSNLDTSTVESDAVFAKRMASDAFASRVLAALNNGDLETAAELLYSSQAPFANESRLRRMYIKQLKDAERFPRVEALLTEFRKSLEEGFFVQALGAFREAANLGRGVAVLEEEAFNAALEEAHRLLPRNWRVAASLLNDASYTNSGLAVPVSLWHEVERAEHDEEIASVLTSTLWVEPEDAQAAYDRVSLALAKYPAEPGLKARLSTLGSALASRQEYESRRKQLAELGGLRDTLESIANLDLAKQLLNSAEAVLAQHSSDVNFIAIVEDMREQVSRGELAASALANDRIEECINECAQVLSQKRHSRLFLTLKEKAEAREVSLAEEYRVAVAQVTKLRQEGKLAAAAEACEKALIRLPRFAELGELKVAIERQIQEQRQLEEQRAADARGLLEKGKNRLQRCEFALAEESFLDAVALFPKDPAVVDYILNVVLAHARVCLLDDWKAAESSLLLASRLQPNLTLPDDLAAAVQQRQLEADAEQEDAATIDIGTALVPWIDARIQRLPPHRSRLSGSLLKLAGVAAALLFTVLLYLSIRQPKTAIFRPTAQMAEIWTKRAEVAPGNGTTIVKAIVPSAPKPTLKPAFIEVTGIEPGTQIRIDGALVGSREDGHMLRQQLAAGPHVIQLFQDGHMQKSLSRQFVPGETTSLAASDFPIESADASTRSAEQQDWDQATASGTAPALQSFTQKYPQSDHLAAAKAQIEQLAWQRVDHSDPNSIQEFLFSFPESPDTAQAQLQLQSLLAAKSAQMEAAKRMQTEQSDWDALDKNNKESVQAFAAKYPAGNHSTTALALVAELDRRTKAVELENSEETAWRAVNREDPRSLAVFVEQFPASRFRAQADQLLSNLRIAESSRLETAAVLSTITRLADAWSAKDLKTIMAIQKNLDKRAVKAELSAREIVMQISAESAPQITGSQATVVCVRRATQIFPDGTRKQIPETTVRYSLMKQDDGGWIIEAAR